MLPCYCLLNSIKGSIILFLTLHESWYLVHKVYYKKKDKIIFYLMCFLRILCRLEKMPAAQGTQQFVKNSDSPSSVQCSESVRKNLQKK